jgi:hypothetical protein
MPARLRRMVQGGKGVLALEMCPTPPHPAIQPLPNSYNRHPYLHRKKLSYHGKGEKGYMSRGAEEARKAKAEASLPFDTTGRYCRCWVTTDRSWVDSEGKS